MSPSQVIVLATPIFLLMIAGEYLLSVVKRRNVYRLNDAINSISLGVLSQLGGLFSKTLAIGIYSALYHSVAPWPDLPFWSTWYGALLALVFYDFCYYWLHRAGHEVAVMWAAHVVHHQSQAYNLSTALRQPSSGVLLGWVFYVPMAIAGVPPHIFAIVALVDLLYQFWVHTELVGKLGWFDRVFCAPSNHRVHHAVNQAYLDKNYGGILIVWDRMFGTYCEERERCVYGTRGALRSWDPLWANLEVYWGLLLESWRTRHWSDKLRVWLKPPGWRPVDVVQRWPKPTFALEQVTLFDPPLSDSAKWFAGVQFLLLLAGVALVLWHAGNWPHHYTAITSAALAICYWAVGAVLQGRLSLTAALLVDCAALATATSALGMVELHLVFKPLVMVLALVVVLHSARRGQISGRQAGLLGAAVTASLIGDVFLMLPGNWFIPGLGAFLVAHLFYLALFRLGLPWFPDRRAVAVMLGIGALVYACLWNGLGGAALKAAVAAYVVAIGLMAGQAIGRASRHADGPGWAVAAGAIVFMVSDSLIAINRFVSPIPYAAFWILITYYLAQTLIILNTRQHRSDP